MIKKLYFSLLTLFISCISEKKPEKSFYPGQYWLDNNGIHINAHGGGILYHQNKYFWYGEHKTTEN